MLDPKSSVLQVHADRQAAGPRTAADHRDYIDDAAALKHLLRHRHVAVVLDSHKASATDEIVDRWVHFLLDKKPSTLAGCAGVLGDELGRALRDAHLHVRHGNHHRMSKDSLGDDPGPAWDSTTFDGIRIIRIRSLDGSDGADAVLRAGAAQHSEDFAFGKLIVDLRGNGGGDDSYVTSWFTPHISTSWTAPCEERGLTLSSSGSSIVYWNYATWLNLNHHAAPEAFTTTHGGPRPDDQVVVTAPGPNLNNEGTIHTIPEVRHPAGSEAWNGRMIIVIDGGTGSSGESAALLLKSAFNAVLVGTASHGVIDYGNSTPYYLPTSGMEIHLPAQLNNWGTTHDFTGIQPDVPLAADTPLHHIAVMFDHLHTTGLASGSANRAHQRFG